jgi:hypothetical protein
LFLAQQKGHEKLLFVRSSQWGRYQRYGPQGRQPRPKRHCYWDP